MARYLDIAEEATDLEFNLLKWSAWVGAARRENTTAHASDRAESYRNMAWESFRAEVARCVGQKRVDVHPLALAEILDNLLAPAP